MVPGSLFICSAFLFGEAAVRVVFGCFARKSTGLPAI